MKNILKLGLLAAGGALGYAGWIERSQMRLTSYHLRWPLPDSLRILHLSDQHFGKDDWVQRRRCVRLAALLPTLTPDIIFFTGDFLHDNDGLERVAWLLRHLPPARLGVYAVLGNHDYALYSYGELFRNMARSIRTEATPQRKFGALVAETGQLGQLAWDIYRNQRLRFAAVPNDTAALAELLAAHGVMLLNNSARPLPGHPHIWVAGVDDRVEGMPDLAQTLGSIPPNAYVILLTHNPDTAYEPAARAIDLVFAGHTHGGQVVLPGLGAIHTQGTRLPRHHAAGLFHLPPGRSQMIVSRGMGESTPLRLGAPPEIVWVEVDGV